MKNSEEHERFKDASWYSPEHLQHIVVGGAGGIGSWLVLFLARIGHTVHLYDMDTVERVNLAGQLYGPSNIGQLKTDSCRSLVQQLTGTFKVVCNGEYTQESLGSPIMFSCFDNMAARRTMFENWKNQEDRKVFIDGRMLAEVGMVFAVTPETQAQYEEFLFDDSEVEDAPCSFKATSHCGALIGSLMVSVFNNYMANSITNMDIREVPFQYHFELPLMNMTEIKTEEHELVEENTGV